MKCGFVRYAASSLSLRDQQPVCASGVQNPQGVFVSALEPLKT